MYTRSKANHSQVLGKVEQKVFIDFDEASDAWKSNKKSIGNGHYKYICQVITASKNKQCEKSCYKGTNTCWIHRSNDKSMNK